MKFEPGDRIVAHRPNGQRAEPRELRGTVTKVPDAAVAINYAANDDFAWLRLDGRERSVPWLVDMLVPMPAIERLAELAREVG